MKQIIMNLNSSDNYLYYKNEIRQGENNASELVVKLNSSWTGYRYLIRFKLNNNNNIVTPELYAADGSITYNINSVLTLEPGTLKVVFEAFNDEGTVIKSAITNLRITESLDGGTEIVPEDYVPWYVKAVNQATIATTQAGIATTKAAEAAQSATDASTAAQTVVDSSLGTETLETESQTVKGAINEVNADLDAHKSDYASQIVEKAGAIKAIKSGMMIAIDAVKNSIIEIIATETAIVKRYGKNLLPYPYNNYIVANGITYTVNDDGSVVANGTAIGVSYYRIAHQQNINAGKYILNGCPAGGSLATYHLKFDLYNGSTYVSSQYDIGEGVLLNIPEGHNCRVYAYVLQGVTATDLTFKPMLRLSSVDDNTYELYKAFDTINITDVADVVAHEGYNTLISDKEIAVFYSSTIQNYVDKLSDSSIKLSSLYRDKIQKHIKNYTLETGTTLETFEDISKWKNEASASGTVSEDTKHVKIGSKTMKLSVTTAGSFAKVTKPHFRYFDETNKIITLWVYFHNPIADYTEVDVILYNNSSKYFIEERNTNIYKRGWNMITITENEFSSVGGAIWTDEITSIGIIVRAVTGKTCAISIDDMRIEQKWIPKIIFRFDDALTGVYTKAYPIMNAKGIAGITYANSEKVGTTGYCTFTELTELYNAGWDIGNHSANHPHFNDLNYVNTLANIKNCQDWLIQNSFFKSARHFAVPHGENTSYVQAVLDDLGMLTSTNSIHATYAPNMDLHDIPAHAIYNTTPVADVTGLIDYAVTTGKTLVLMFHTVADEALDQYDYSTTNFQAVIDYVYNNGYVKYVVTMSEYYEGLNRNNKWDDDF